LRSGGASRNNSFSVNIKAKSIPDGCASAIPYLACKDAARAIEFYKQVFDATELMRFPMPDGRLGHGEIKIGGALVMLADEFPHLGGRSPETLGGTSVNMLIYVTDVDALVKRAIAAGAEVLSPLADQFYGDRNCKLSDPFGHVWMFATHQEDVSPREMQKRAHFLFGKK
jgi:PhnB protein